MVVVGTDYVVVLDHLLAQDEHRYDARFQLSEEAFGATTVVEMAAGTRVESPGLAIVRPVQPGALTTVDAGFVSYRYGHKYAAPVVRTQLQARTAWLSHVLLAGEASRNRPRIDIAVVEPEGEATAFGGIVLAIDGGETRDVLFVNPDASGRWTAAGATFAGACALLRTPRGSDARMQLHVRGRERPASPPRQEQRP